MNIDFNEETFFNLVKMLKATDEDRDLALETIKNLKLEEYYHTLFLKDLVFINRNAYREAFNLSYSFQEMTIKELYKRIKTSKDEVAKNIFAHITNEFINSGYTEYSFLDIKTKIKW